MFCALSFPHQKAGQCKYFNCDLQTQSGLTRAVCFATEKLTTFNTLSQQKSPVKIKKYKISTTFNRKDVQISKYTEVEPLPADTNLGFQYNQGATIMSISELNHVTSGQLVTIKGKVIHLTGTKTIAHSTGPLRKQECCIVDPSGHINITLWENYIDTIEESKTYQFNKFRLRSFRSFIEHTQR